MAIDGSLLGIAGKWRARGWYATQLDYDGELGPLHGMCGSMEAELDVQRINPKSWRMLTAFLCILKKVMGFIKLHLDNKGIVDGPRRGEGICIDRKAGDADLWIKICALSTEISVEVEQERAHMSHFERFVTDGDEKDVELAEEDAMWDEGFMAQVRANYGLAEARRSVCSPAVRNQFSQLDGGMERLRGT